MNYNDIKLQEMIEESLTKIFGVYLHEANVKQIYVASSITINDILRQKRKIFNHKVKDQNAKRVHYLSIEFLLGKSLKNNLYNLGLVDEISKVLSKVDLTLDDLYLLEPDAGLGNGGLGRLGAAFLDALASLNYPAMGHSILYEYGLFKQKIVDGWQTELPDIWLPGGRVWLSERSDKVYTVRFDGQVYETNVNGQKVYEYHNYNEVEAVPYDIMISGAGSEAISVLRLWKSQNIHNFDISSFSQGDYNKAMQEKLEADLISKVLYPGDEHYEGKLLRIKQHYFLASAAMQNIVAEHKKHYHDIRLLPKYVAIHINDTHPSFCIPELMRILIDEENLNWDEAWNIVTKVVSYTNHTVMQEALERWPEDLVMKKLPRIYVILKQINEHFINEIRCLGIKNKELQDLVIFNHNEIRMANLSVIASHTVNGVSNLHSDIIKHSVFSSFYQLNPHKFVNVTNGISYRRWLYQSNTLLRRLLKEKIGEKYYFDANFLKAFKDYYNDDEVLNSLEKIKYLNKCSFAKYLYYRNQIVIDPNTRFDVHVKRIHEYKRQLLNALKIIYLLTLLEENPNLNMTPQTFIFGGKAAGSYYVAKQIIELICNLSIEISKNKNIQEKLNVVFIEEYNVSVAEKLIPASEISEQISLAGKEASGTGNMKFMINGAITFGTLDGANIEILENVGEENIFIFGMKAKEVNALWRRGYDAHEFYERSDRIKKVIERLNRGFNGKSFAHISDYLLNNYPVSDPYMCLADFDSYVDKHFEMDRIYQDQKRWNQMSLMNICNAGIFSADRAIREYAEKIWKLKVIM